MALVPDQKFSTFQDGGDLAVGDTVVGLRAGINTKFNYTGELPVGVIVPIANGGTGASTASGARTNLGNLAYVPSLPVTDNAVARYDAAGGALQNSVVLIDDSGNVTGVNSITLGSPITVANGGTGLSTLSPYRIMAAGTTATGNMQQIAAGSTGQLLQSQGASALATYTTATYPSTVTANNLIFATATNVVGQVSTANSATLVTNSSGVPSYTASMTNGQVLIGSTGATPTPATLTAAGSTVITNAAGSITITTPNNVSKNLIIGGNFDTNPWQRGTTFTGVATATYSADRFRLDYVTSAVTDINQQTDAPTVAESGIFTRTSLRVSVTTADAAIAAGDFYIIQQRIEGYNWALFAQRTLTLSFWVKAFKTGIYCVGLRNNGADRSYVAEYTVNASNTWEFKTITISASPSAGTWNYTNGLGINLSWALAAGSTFHGTAGVWNTANVFATANQVNGLDSTSNTFQLALIQLEAGAVNTSFEVQSFEEVLSACQRYYTKTFILSQAPVQNSGTLVGAIIYRASNAGVGQSGVNWTFPVWMRVSPTLTYYNPQAANNNWRNTTVPADSAVPTTIGLSNRGSYIANAQVAGDTLYSALAVHAQADAEL